VTGRALLLGSATYGLTGVDHDVATMAALLHDRGFDAVTTVTGSDATRDGMRAALDRLCRDTGPGDAVVLYYSGHGSRLLRPDAVERRAQGREPYVQFLVPTDVDATTASDFRGLVGGELTAATRALTSTTRNVTVLLDCCHAGAMVRGLDLVPKSTQPALVVDAGAELADRLAPEGHLGVGGHDLAAGVHESADGDGERAEQADEDADLRADREPEVRRVDDPAQDEQRQHAADDRAHDEHGPGLLEQCGDEHEGRAGEDHPAEVRERLPPGRLRGPLQGGAIDVVPGQDECNGDDDGAYRAEDPADGRAEHGVPPSVVGLQRGYLSGVVGASGSGFTSVGATGPDGEAPTTSSFAAPGAFGSGTGPV
jgi:hypothetical protein